MENRMDRPGQPSRDEQSSSLEGKPFSSPELPQEPSITSTLSPEQRLFIRILCLTLLLGIMIGIDLTLFVALCYVLTGSIPYAFYPTSPLIYRLLAPLLMISIGFVYLLARSMRRLLRQHPTFQFGRLNLSGNPSWLLANLSIGLLFIWIGIFMVILSSFPVDFNIWGTVELVGIVVLIVTLCAETVLWAISSAKQSGLKKELQ